MRAANKDNRIWELDFFRGTALFLMVYFHIIYDMDKIFGYKVNYESGMNFIIGKISAILFIAISGISCSLSGNNFKRGLKILAFALIITAATWLYDPEFVVLFGILHFLGICVMISGLLMLPGNYFLWTGGTFIISAGIFLNHIFIRDDYLFVFGIRSSGFSSADYYPLMPWLGFFMYGLGLGRVLYRDRKSIFKFSLKDNIISRAGRKTLICYMLHQPVIIGIMTLLALLK